MTQKNTSNRRLRFRGLFWKAARIGERRTRVSGDERTNMTEEASIFFSTSTSTLDRLFLTLSRPFFSLPTKLNHSNQASASAPGSRSGASRWPYRCFSGDSDGVRKRRETPLFFFPPFFSSSVCKKPEERNTSTSPPPEVFVAHRHLSIVLRLIQRCISRSASCIFLYLLSSCRKRNHEELKKNCSIKKKEERRGEDFFFRRREVEQSNHKKLFYLLLPFFFFSFT